MCVVILPSHTNAASAVIDLTPVGYVGTTMKSNYYVVFAARPLSSTGSSFGHAFLGVGIEDYDMNRSSYIAYGEWPSGSASGALLRLSKLPARVLQETLSKTDRDSSGHSPFDYTETLIVKVTEEAHDALQKEIQRYNRVETAPPLTYALISNDCATFAATIATELG